ncbi:MAG: hypothetical protein JXA33_01260 [Anaerolineae bacterium]|nr:hypothetical protein [Anaerolineae bacterium]
MADIKARGIGKLLPIYQNLPQSDYGCFIGREKELAKIHELLSPKSCHFLITIDGIGGIGKSSLALEVAHRYLEDDGTLPGGEHFDAIIWVSAKQEILTANSVIQRQRVLTSLESIYVTISITLEREDITRAQSTERAELVRRALTKQRTLLIIDNLETVKDDEEVLGFLYELPAPTKAIVTSRCRVDVAYSVRLDTLLWEEARQLIVQECAVKKIRLTPDQTFELYQRTGGVPLAIVWCIGLMGLGYSVKTVLYLLKDPTNDIVRFCFEKIREQIRYTLAYKLLILLALFASGTSEKALCYLAGDEHDDMTFEKALADLEKLSLISRISSERLTMLPLTRLYVLSDSSIEPQMIPGLRIKQIDYYLRHIALPEPFPLYLRELVDHVRDERDNILDLMEWCVQHNERERLLDLFLRVQDFLGVFGLLDLRIIWGKYIIEIAEAENRIADLGRLYAVTLGWAALKRGELDQAEVYLQQGLEFIERNSNKGLAYTAKRFQSRLWRLQGRTEESEQMLMWLLARAKEEGFSGLVAGIESDLAYAEMLYNHDLRSAEAYIRSSICGFRDLGDSVRVADRSIIKADILVLQKQFAEAEACLLPNLEIVEKTLGQLEAVAHGYACLAHIRAHQGESVGAAQCCRYAREVYDRIGMQAEIFPIGLPEIGEQ